MSRGLTFALAAAAALLALLLLLPLGGLVWRALSDGDVAAELGSGATWNALRLSLITATITAVIAVLLGTPLAWLLARSRTRAARLAASLLARKVASIERLAPAAIATGNIGCMTHIGSASTVPVVHTVERLDWASGGPRPGALPA